MMTRTLLSGILLLLCCTLHAATSTPEEQPYPSSTEEDQTSYSPTAEFIAPPLPAIPADSTAKVPFLRRGWDKLYNYIAHANVDKTQTKKLDLTILGGPHYSTETQFGIGIVAAGLFRLDRSDLSIPPSNVSLFGDLTTTGAYVLGIRGNTYFNGGKYRLDHATSFYFRPSNFWGVGYDGGHDSTSCEMDRQQIQTRIDFLYQIFPKWYIGANASYQFTRALDIEKPWYIPEGEDSKYINTGVGFSVSYDSRDVITDPYTGFYFKIDQRFFPKFLGNKDYFTSNELIADYYTPIWKGAILATDLHGLFHRGDVPWTMLSLMGGSSRMRGYYEGRYRDKDLLELQVELRQKLYKRFGGVVWVGVGNVFPDFKSFDISHTLPTYGLGLRWEFKKRVNVRVDCGFGEDTVGFMFNINEAF